MQARQFHLCSTRRHGVDQVIAENGGCMNVYDLKNASMPARPGMNYMYGEHGTRSFGFEFSAAYDEKAISPLIAWYSNTFYQGSIILLVALPAALLN